MADTQSLYKLVILYMLKSVNFPLTNNHITDCILEQGYTDYFHVQQAISELVESALVSKKTVRNTSQYKITEEGMQTLGYFSNQISEEIVADIDHYLRENSYDLRNEMSNIADYYKLNSMEYEVHCRVLEGERDLIDLRIVVPSEEAAKRSCDRWPQVSQDIYRTLITKLTSASEK